MAIATVDASVNTVELFARRYLGGDDDARRRDLIAWNLGHFRANHTFWLEPGVILNITPPETKTGRRLIIDGKRLIVHERSLVV